MPNDVIISFGRWGCGDGFDEPHEAMHDEWIEDHLNAKWQYKIAHEWGEMSSIFSFEIIKIVSVLLG